MTKRLLIFDGLLQTQHTCPQLSPTAPCHRNAARNTEQLFLGIMRTSIVDDILTLFTQQQGGKRQAWKPADAFYRATTWDGYSESGLSG